MIPIACQIYFKMSIFTGNYYFTENVYPLQAFQYFRDQQSTPRYLPQEECGHISTQKPKWNCKQLHS